MKAPDRYTIKRHKGGWILVYTIEGERARIPYFSLDALFVHIKAIEGNAVISDKAENA